jgi:hypothetical protein
MQLQTSVGITASDMVGRVTFKFLVNPDYSTEVSLYHLEKVVLSVMNVKLGLEDKMMQIKTKHFMHGIAIRCFIF